MAGVVVFEKCDCSAEHTHGYFTWRGNEGDVPPMSAIMKKDGGSRISPPISSMVMGRYMLENLADSLEGQDVTVLEQQMRDAGLPEVALGTEEDDEMGAEILLEEMGETLRMNSYRRSLEEALQKILPGIRVTAIQV